MEQDLEQISLEEGQRRIDNPAYADHVRYERFRKEEARREERKDALGIWKWLPLAILIFLILNSIFGKQSKTEELIQNLKDQERATREMGNNE